jgi:hypothetical protein
MERSQVRREPQAGSRAAVDKQEHAATAPSNHGLDSCRQVTVNTTPAQADRTHKRLRCASPAMHPDSWRSYTGTNLRRSSPV